jgi:hypothetical protein
MKISSIASLFVILILSFTALGEEVEIETRSHTTPDGITHVQKLALELSDLELSPNFDPAKEEVPISIKKAVALAQDFYLKQSETGQFSLGNIELNRFPHYKHRDKWFYQIEVLGNPFKGEPAKMIAVLLNGKVVLSQSSGT